MKSGHAQCMPCMRCMQLLMCLGTWASEQLHQLSITVLKPASKESTQQLKDQLTLNLSPASKSTLFLMRYCRWMGRSVACTLTMLAIPHALACCWLVLHGASTDTQTP